jgi:hypothetical protein
LIDAIIAAAAGFLSAVLWFDLMFDVQVIRHRGSAVLPEEVLDSISRYYRRVTTTASPMGRLVGLAMAVLLVGLVVQGALGEAPFWVSIVSIPAALLAIGLAVVRVFGRARRLGERKDSEAVQSDLARSICRDHFVCLGAMSLLLAVQIAGA